MYSQRGKQNEVPLNWTGREIVMNIRLMNIRLIHDDIRFTRYRMTCTDLGAASREAVEARLASLERELILLNNVGAAWPSAGRGVDHLALTMQNDF
jgi:hypothetical protein